MSEVKSSKAELILEENKSSSKDQIDPASREGASHVDEREQIIDFF